MHAPDKVVSPRPYDKTKVISTAVDYRRQLFQIEQWSPGLAKKIWGLTKFLESPFNLALGLKITHLTDLAVEVHIPFTIQNKNEFGEMHPSVMMSAAEFASRALWRRHTKTGMESLFLEAVQATFVKEAASAVKVRAGLPETERESILRKLRQGEAVRHEMTVSLIDEKKQSLGQVNCTWRFKLLRPLALQSGN